MPSSAARRPRYETTPQPSSSSGEATARQTSYLRPSSDADGSRCPGLGCPVVTAPRSAGPPVVGVKEVDRVKKRFGSRSLQVLASILLLRGEPRVVAMDGEAQNPLFAE